jgi:hypothetical protein
MRAQFPPFDMAAHIHIKLITRSPTSHIHIYSNIQPLRLLSMANLGGPVEAMTLSFNKKLKNYHMVSKPRSL